MINTKHSFNHSPLAVAVLTSAIALASCGSGNTPAETSPTLRNPAQLPSVVAETVTMTITVSDADFSSQIKRAKSGSFSLVTSQKSSFEDVTSVEAIVYVDDALYTSVLLTKTADEVWTGVVSVPVNSLVRTEIEAKNALGEITYFGDYTTTVESDEPFSIGVELTSITDGEVLSPPRVSTFEAPVEIAAGSTADISFEFSGTANSIIAFELITDESSGSYSPSAGNVALDATGTGTVSVSYQSPAVAGQYGLAVALRSETLSGIGQNPVFNFSLTVVDQVQDASLSIVWPPVLHDIDYALLGNGEVQLNALVSDDGDLSAITYQWQTTTTESLLNENEEVLIEPSYSFVDATANPVETDGYSGDALSLRLDLSDGTASTSYFFFLPEDFFGATSLPNTEARFGSARFGQSTFN